MEYRQLCGLAGGGGGVAPPEYNSTTTEDWVEESRGELQ